MSRTLIVIVCVVVTLLTSDHCVTGYDIHGVVNEPLHIDDSQVTLFSYCVYLMYALLDKAESQSAR